MYRVENDIMKVGMNQAIKDLQMLERALIKSNDQLADKIKDEGLKIIRRNADMMVNSEEAMLENLKSVATDHNVGEIIRAGRVTEVELMNTSDKAKYIEYGTGITGKDNAHPELPSSWIYYKLPSNAKRTVNEVQGWFNSSSLGYRKFFTGMPSQPFYWQSKIDIKKKLPKWFSTLLKKNMKGGMK